MKKSELSKLFEKINDNGEKKFKQEYLGVWIEPDSKYEAALKLWIEYYYYTEQYERSICSGFNEKTGSAIPTNSYEYLTINRNANRQRRIMDEERKKMGIDIDTFKRANNEISKYNHEQIVKLKEKFKLNEN